LFKRGNNPVAELLRETDKKLGRVRRLLRNEESTLRRIEMARDGIVREKETREHNRLASYLGAGTVQTLSPHRFRDDMIRSRWMRRVMVGLGALGLILLVYWLVS
jgi:precorrin isomerase